MRVDPLEEWRRLTEHYREMSDEELYELDGSIGDLTEQAQQILRDEMRTRRLNRPRLASAEAGLPERSAAPGRDSSAEAKTAAGERGKTGDEEENGPYEYTWKTLLCECEDREQAWQLRQALKSAGIESWVEGPGYRVTADWSNRRILVAADQLEEAREIASRPISQAIVEQSKMEIPEYEPPECPKCGAEDPVLEGVDPVNCWRCESCGKQWTESVGVQDESLDRANIRR